MRVPQVSHVQTKRREGRVSLFLRLSLAGSPQVETSSSHVSGCCVPRVKHVGMSWEIKANMI